MNAPPAVPEPPKPKLVWYEQVWIALPIGLVAVGGAIGGLCGGAAWAINKKVFQKTESVVLRYLWTGLISAAAVIAYIVLAAVFVSLVRRRT